MKETYVIGVDYGTQSARAQVVSLLDGRAMGEAVYVYPHGVMSSSLPDGTPLPGMDWALAHPQDYWEALVNVVPQAMCAAGVQPDAVKGLSIAATACTLLPVDAALTPLCLLPALKREPHAYIKLWKHHRAEGEARCMTRIAQERGETFVSSYGGAVSSEWAMPKMLEVYREAPQVYQAAAYFMQFSDWLDSRLTGNIVRSGGIAAYKALYDRQKGYPNKEYLEKVDPALPQMVAEKLQGRICWPGERAGNLTKQAAQALGLLPGTAVGAGHTDAHAAALGAGVSRSGDYLAVLGTSSVTHFLHSAYRTVPGISGALRDGLLPDLICYTAGQPCVGDMLEWFVRRIAPKDGDYQQLEAQAARLRPGENGLLALDWWNGNRSILANSCLSGTLLGLNMNTTAAEIYRALMESAAFGQRMIRDQYLCHGLEPQRIILCGGMAQKSPLMCQILADVLNMPLEIAGTSQTTARGAAMCAAAAVGRGQGGYDSLTEAVEHLRPPCRGTVYPIAENQQRYDRLFTLFHQLHDLLGVEHPVLMESLRALQLEKKQKAGHLPSDHLQRYDFPA